MLTQFPNPELRKSPAKTPCLRRSSNVYDLMLTGMQRRRTKRDNSVVVVVSPQGGGFQPTACKNCPQTAFPRVGAVPCKSNLGSQVQISFALASRVQAKQADAPVTDGKGRNLAFGPKSLGGHP
jgi:hypothetical protein